MERALGEGILLLPCWHSSIEINMPISSRDLKGTFHKTSIGVAVGKGQKIGPRFYDLSQGRS